MGDAAVRGLQVKICSSGDAIIVLFVHAALM
jgi:hypothetical protein